MRSEEGGGEQQTAGVGDDVKDAKEPGRSVERREEQAPEGTAVEQQAGQEMVGRQEEGPMIWEQGGAAAAGQGEYGPF